MPDLKSRSVPELLRLYGRVLDELREREIIRSGNNLVADHAENLVVKALTLKRAGASMAGYDATDSSGKRYQIKGRRLTPQHKSRQLGIIRGMDQQNFDFLVGVLFDDDYSVRKACRVPFAVVKEIAKPNKHQNGWIVHLPDSLWDRPDVRDITKEVQAVIATLTEVGPIN